MSRKKTTAQPAARKADPDADALREIARELNAMADGLEDGTYAGDPAGEADAREAARRIVEARHGLWDQRQDERGKLQADLVDRTLRVCGKVVRATVKTGAPARAALDRIAEGIASGVINDLSRLMPEHASAFAENRRTIVAILRADGTPVGGRGRHEQSPRPVLMNDLYRAIWQLSGDAEVIRKRRDRRKRSAR